MSELFLLFIIANAGLSLAVQVRFTAHVHHGIEQQLHRRLTGLDTVGQSQGPLNVPADGLQAVLEPLVTVVLLAAAGVIATVVLVTAPGHGGDADVELKSKHR